MPAAATTSNNISETV